jgi:DNA polymerase (family 10)
VPGYLDAHFHVVPPSDFGVALVSATGSAGHVAALARAAETKGLQLDERSLRKHSRRIPVPTEEALYSRLDLAFVPPELREDAGEVEAAGTGELPEDLVRLEDLRGAVHCHTQYSDGRHSIEEMARAAEELGLAYLTITDHSASATYARGLDLDRLQRQSDEIARVRSG